MNIRFLCFLTSVACMWLTVSLAQNPVGYVRPEMGSQSEFALSSGNVYPCIARPWGMNHWTPQTAPNGERWQYTYDAHHIVGLKQTHQPSPWVGDYGMFSLMATVGERVFAEQDRRSWFSHKAETVHPHYYSVYLADYDVRAELSPTERAAFFRFTFPQSDESRIIIDAFDTDSYIQVIPEERKVVGYSTQSYGYDERKPDNFVTYFVILFDKPFREHAIWSDGSFLENCDEQHSKHTGVVLTFETKTGERISARAASSFISMEQAERNLQQEIGDRSFDEVVREGRDAWNTLLGRFRITDREPDDLDKVQTFYTCLYRLLLYPREFHEYDATGRAIHYSPYNGRIESGLMYTDNGFWDTFRAVHPFFNLFFPEQSARIMEGLANTYRESGWLPEWASPGHLGDAMIGSNSTSLVASAYLQGIDMDIDLLWEAVMKNSRNAHPKYISVGRSGIEAYLKYGYVPNDIGLKESAARTLEYCYADFCLYRLAEALGRKKEQTEFADRALNYRNLFYPEFGVMAGRNSAGEFRPDFNPLAWGGDFTEGCALHYTWSVFHDPKGLAALMGGRESFVTMLDTVFTTPPIFDYSAYGTVIHEMREMQVADFGQYAHGNQPIQHMIYLYDWAGEPWKAQYWTRQVMSRLYRPTPDGYCGDEDNGQTSAWYLFSALGFYPVCPVTGEFAIGSPLFREVEITMPEGKILRLSAPDNDDSRPYIRTIRRNGRRFDRNYFTFEELRQGGRICFTMDSLPNRKRGIAPEALPYSFSDDQKQQ